MIDLHIHSTFSDGSLTPSALAAEAQRIALTAVALTDHDGLGGVPEFLKACTACGVRGIAGVELSVDVPKGCLHMLGYFLDPGHAGLIHALAELRASRAERNVRILEKLNCLGLTLNWDEVAACAGEDVVGRPHFARALQARGYVQSKIEAFERYLAKGKPAYVDRYRLSPAAGIAVIREAGGVAVLAHPLTLKRSRGALRRALIEWKELGLAGVEAYYSEYDAGKTGLYLALCRDLDLAPTGGSDFHGLANPAIHMGVGFGELRVPDELLAGLEARRG
ncbi:MAG: PHP domain-containing protein [bacterium]